MSSGRQRFEREEIESSSRMDELAHGPPKRSERDHLDGVWEVEYCAEYAGRYFVVH